MPAENPLPLTPLAREPVKPFNVERPFFAKVHPKTELTNYQYQELLRGTRVAVLRNCGDAVAAHGGQPGPARRRRRRTGISPTPFPGRARSRPSPTSPWRPSTRDVRSSGA